MARTAKPIDPERDDKLVTVAADRFATVGFDGTSLNQVLSEAGWQKSSFYHYFADKRGLHDHVVDTLAARLIGTATAPDLADLTADSFWPAMDDFLAGLGESARHHPETRMLGEMFHHDRSGSEDRAVGESGPVGELGQASGQLQRLRDAVGGWLARAVVRGRDLGVVRDDLPEELLIELTMAVLQTLDRWALRHELDAPGGPSEEGISLRLVRDLIEATR